MLVGLPIVGLRSPFLEILGAGCLLLAGASWLRRFRAARVSARGIEQRVRLRMEQEGTDPDTNFQRYYQLRAEEEQKKTP